MKISQEAMRYALALSFAEGIGPIRAKKLIQHFGDPESVFRASNKDLMGLSGFAEGLIKLLKNQDYLVKADRELERAEKEAWQIHYFQDSAYPRRLHHCEDAPLILFQKGNMPLNASRVLAIVGSRNMSDYGKHFLENFVRDLVPYGVLVVSGLAYGVDAWAHRMCNENGIVNAAVLAHGLDRVYPGLHRSLAQDIVQNGGAMLTEFPCQTNPDRENFPKRNRIVAGLCDAVLVVEAARKGGALITADLANQYNRDVFALPGRFDDPLSEGCNNLIKSHRAHLLAGLKDLEYTMRWELLDQEKPGLQLQIFEDLLPEEQKVVRYLGKSREAMQLDLIQHNTGLPNAQLLRVLMQIELKGIIESLPGSRFRLRS
jgi:DNA processing protein